MDFSGLHDALETPCDDFPSQSQLEDCIEVWMGYRPDGWRTIHVLFSYLHATSKLNNDEKKEELFRQAMKYILCFAKKGEKEQNVRFFFDEETGGEVEQELLSLGERLLKIAANAPRVPNRCIEHTAIEENPAM